MEYDQARVRAEEIAWQAAGDREHAAWLASGEADDFPDLLAAWQTKRKAERTAAEAEWDAIEKACRTVCQAAESTDQQIEAAEATRDAALDAWRRRHNRLFGRPLPERDPSEADERMWQQVEVDSRWAEMQTQQREYWKRVEQATMLKSNVVPLPGMPAPELKIRPRRIDAATLDGKPVPAREWLVRDLIPARNVTLLYGDGGTGKSLLALQLAASTVTGTPFFGRLVAGGRVEFVTAEDSLDEMHRRLIDVARSAGTSLGALAGLNLTSLAEEDAILAAPEDGRGGALAATALYNELDDVLAESRPALLVLDTLADTFGGNEIIRAQVRQFVSMLRRLALRHGCTIVVLAHPSLAGMEKGTSGSTGWSNSVRSRLYFQRVHESDGSEADEDARVLRVAKSNYGRVGLEIAMRWQAGVFVPLALTAGGESAAANAKAERVFVELLTRYTAQDRPVSLSPSAAYAPKIFETEARAHGVGKRALTLAMGRLLDYGRIANVPYGPPSRGTKRLVVSPDKCSPLTPPPPSS
jgi:archaellum biogenesis ATPase FlaH